MKTGLTAIYSYRGTFLTHVVVPFSFFFLSLSNVSLATGCCTVVGYLPAHVQGSIVLSTHGMCLNYYFLSFFISHGLISPFI